MPSPYLANFVDEECDYKPWYETGQNWIQLARNAIALQKGTRPESNLSRVPFGQSPMICLPDAESAGEKAWLGRARAASISAKVGCGNWDTPSDAYDVIFYAATKPVVLCEAKGWLEKARSASLVSRRVGAFSEQSRGLPDAYSVILEAAAEPTADWVISTPSDEPTDIQNAIKSSHVITDLRDNWDGEGTRGYSIDTWNRATGFLSAHATLAHAAGDSIGVPSISPAEHGSIDIHWLDEERELLVNIPSNAEEFGTYYGRKRSGDTVSGVLNTNTLREDLVAWLTQNNQNIGR